MRLFLIRHGQTPSNVAGLLDTRVPGPVLTVLGEEQAAALPLALAGETIEKIVVSDMVRTHLTAAPLAREKGLTAVERGAIREIAAGDYEMRSDPRSVRAYMGAVFAWAEGELERRIPGGESGREVFARFNGALAEAVEERRSSVALVTHGALIRAWVGFHAVNVSAEFTIDNPIENTGIVVLDGDPASGWTALSWMGEPVGGESVRDAANVGPAGEAVR